MTRPKARSTRTEIGAYEAKTRLPELLRQVQVGRRFTITNRGKPVAELGPPSAPQISDPKAAIEAFRDLRKTHPLHHELNIKDLIEEGRG